MMCTTATTRSPLRTVPKFIGLHCCCFTTFNLQVGHILQVYLFTMCCLSSASSTRIRCDLLSFVMWMISVERSTSHYFRAGFELFRARIGKILNLPLFALQLFTKFTTNRPSGQCYRVLSEKVERLIQADDRFSRLSARLLSNTSFYTILSQQKF